MLFGGWEVRIVKNFKAEVLLLLLLLFYLFIYFYFFFAPQKIKTRTKSHESVTVALGTIKENLTI